MRGSFRHKLKVFQGPNKGPHGHNLDGFGFCALFHLENVLFSGVGSVCWKCWKCETVLFSNPACPGPCTFPLYSAAKLSGPLAPLSLHACYQMQLGEGSWHSQYSV